MPDEIGVNKDICDERMSTIQKTLLNIKDDTANIVEKMLVIGPLCEKVSNIERRISIIESKFDSLWKTAMVTLVGLIVTIISGVIVFIITRNIIGV